MLCPKCHEEVPETLYCMNCGARLIPHTDDYPDVLPPRPDKIIIKRHRRSKADTQ